MSTHSTNMWVQKRKNKKVGLALLLLVLILYFIIIPFSRLPDLNSYKNMFAPIVLPNTYNPRVNLKTGEKQRDITTKDKNDDKEDMVDLRTIMDYHFPYNPLGETPKHIWQTWKVSLRSPDFPSNYKTFSKGWQKKALYNPALDLQKQELEDDDELSRNNKNKLPKDPKDDQWIYSMVDDAEAEALVETIFQEVPSIIQAFKILPSPILKADFFRYLILYSRGGIYSDMDTVPLKFLNTWPGNNPSYIKEKVFKNDIQNTDHIIYKNMDLSKRSGTNAQNTVPSDYNTDLSKLKQEQKIQETNETPLQVVTPGLVIGIEADPDRPDWATYYARRIQFCQWTIQSKPGHPVLRELIINITETTLNSVSNPYINSGSKLYSLETTEQAQKDFVINDRGRNSKAGSKGKKDSMADVDGTDIMNWTGPGIFSDIVFSYMNNLLQYNKDIYIVNKNLESDDTQKSTKKFYKQISAGLMNENSFHWGFFSLMKDPVLVDDVLVLPITAFSPDVGHMGSMGSGEDIALVKHYFSGSWKDE